MDALAELTPISDGYATLPIAAAFDWSGVARQLGSGEWYMVAFRSIRRIDADEDRLTKYDHRAHIEASSAPGFVHYYKGPAAPDRSCLSFCLWTSRPEARAAAGGPNHVEAVSLLNEMYESYYLEFLRVTGAVGQALSFEPYDRPVVDDPSPITPPILPRARPLLAPGPS
jgi:hypothetical protein